MKKIRFSGKARYVAGLAAAVLVGGAFASVAFATIPGGDGTISACYNKKNGALKVIDPSAGGACTNKENPLSWSAGGSGGLELLDANGQDLGTLIDFKTNSGTYTVYNSTLNRIISMSDSSDASGNPTFSYGDTNTGIVFASSDCTGPAYADLTSYVKTDFYSWPSGSTTLYGIVADNATTTGVTAGSIWEPGNDFCEAGAGDTESLYPITTVSLPYTNPVWPVKIQQ